MIYRAPDSQEPKSDDSEGLEAAASDILDAITAGDKKRLASAIKAAFEICDSLPHEEGPHTNDEQE